VVEALYSGGREESKPPATYGKSFRHGYVANPPRESPRASTHHRARTKVRTSGSQQHQRQGIVRIRGSTRAGRITCEVMFRRVHVGKRDALIYRNNGYGESKKTNCRSFPRRAYAACRRRISKRKALLFLNTLRSVSNDDGSWFSLLPALTISISNIRQYDRRHMVPFS